MTFVELRWEPTRAWCDPTRAAIDAAFGLPQGAHDAWNAVDLQIADAQSDQVTVAYADRIWPRVDGEPDQAWIDLLASYHGAAAVPLDYVADREGSRRTINDWVAERTEGLIPELLPEGFIRSNTVLVLTDALYFAADWERPFGKYGSVDGVFTTLDGTEKPTSLRRELELADRRRKPTCDVEHLLASASISDRTPTHKELHDHQPDEPRRTTKCRPVSTGSGRDRIEAGVHRWPGRGRRRRRDSRHG